jgi:hypothetical protein
MLLPRLVGQRVPHDRLVNVPPLVAGDLKNEDIMHVVVGGEPSIFRRRDVRIDLNWMTQLCGQVGGKVDDWRPGAMKALQHQRAAAAQLGQDPVVGRLICDASSRAASPREAGRGKHGPVLCHSEEWGAQAAAGHEVVDRGRVEEIGEVPIELGLSGE